MSRIIGLEEGRVVSIKPPTLPDLTTACLKCNRSKSGKFLKEWQQ